MPLTDFLPPEEIEEKFRKRFGRRAELFLWLGVGLIGLVVAIYFSGLGGPRGKEVFADGRVSAAELAALRQKHPGLTLQPGMVDLWRPLLAAGQGNLLAPRWWRLARFNPSGRARALGEGITTAVTVGDPLEWVLTFGRSIAGGRLAGPRVVPAIVLAHPRRLLAWEEGAARAVADPGQAGAVVRETIGQGARMVVVDIREEPRPAGSVVSAACTAARGLKRPCAVLVPAGRADTTALEQAVQARADFIVGLPADVLPDWLVERLATSKAVVAPGIGLALPALRPPVAANAYRAHRAGVKLALASGGESMPAEVGALLRTGMPAADLATMNEEAARALGLEPGGAVVGRPADIVGLDPEGRPGLVVAAGRQVVP